MAAGRALEGYALAGHQHLGRAEGRQRWRCLALETQLDFATVLGQDENLGQRIESVELLFNFQGRRLTAFQQQGAVVAAAQVAVPGVFIQHPDRHRQGTARRRRQAEEIGIGKARHIADRIGNQPGAPGKVHQLAMAGLVAVAEHPRQIAIGRGVQLQRGLAGRRHRRPHLLPAAAAGAAVAEKKPVAAAGPAEGANQLAIVRTQILHRGQFQLAFPAEPNQVFQQQIVLVAGQHLGAVQERFNLHG